MSKATFYEHFDNKEDCIVALHDAATRPCWRRCGGPATTTPAPTRPAACARSSTRSSRCSPRSPTRRRRCWSRSSAPARARWSGATACSPSTRAYVDDVNREDAERGGAPRLASPHDAFAIVGAVVELASRQIRTGEPDDIRDLEPVVERLVLGLHARGATRRRRERGAGARRPRGGGPRVPPLPAARRVARAGRAREARGVPRRDVLGPADRAASATRRARVLLLGLAPAAHGANRTGRVFTGDRSGDFLFAALHRTGLRQPAGVGAPRRRAGAARLLDHRGGALRAAGEQAAAVRARHVRGLAARRAGAARRACASSSASARSRGRPAFRPARAGAAAAAALRPRRGGGGRASSRCSAASTRASRTRSRAS